MAKFSVIVVAAGKGARFDDKENKIFTRIEDQPVFLRALQLFCNREDVCQTILVVSPGDIEKMKSQYSANLGFMGVNLVEGGTERFESVAKGLAKVVEEADFVAVHDAVRICVAQQWIDKIFEAAVRWGTAVPTTPVTATLKRIGDQNEVGETIPRSGLHMAQTPQVFRRKILQDAYSQLGGDGADSEGNAITDDAQVVTSAGTSVTAVESDARNIKITTKSDLGLAKAILRSLPQKPIASRSAFEEAQW